METINVEKIEFNRILNVAEALVNEVEQVFSQEEIAKRRMGEIKLGIVTGKTEEDYNEYLKKRGIFVGS